MSDSENIVVEINKNNQENFKTIGAGDIFKALKLSLERSRDYTDFILGVNNTELMEVK